MYLKYKIKTVSTSVCVIIKGNVFCKTKKSVLGLKNFKHIPKKHKKIDISIDFQLLFFIC